MGDRTARHLSARLGELASLAERTGAAPRAIERLLEAASVASMNALALELATAAVPVAEPEQPVAAPLRRAA